MSEIRKLVWVGNRESEIESCCAIFAYSITVYGSGANNNFSLIHPHSNQNSLPERNLFIVKTIRGLLELSDNYRFLFYSNQMTGAILKIAPDLADSFLCVNDSSVLGYLNSKTYTKLWLSHRVPMVRFALLAKQELSYNRLLNIFSKNDKFVIQDDRSSGGIGTFLFSKHNATDIIDRLSASQLFVVSPYVSDSYSVNCHIVISGQEILIYPPSLQVVEVTDYQFLYKGSDFITANTFIPSETNVQLHQYCKTIGEMLRDIRYRGVCGLDFLVSGEKIYLMEVNPRFQASSLLLDYALREQFGVGLIDTHIAAFNDSISEEQRQAADYVAVSFSSLSFYLYGERCFYRYIHDRLQGYSGTDCICRDQQDIDSAVRGSYLFRALFREPVTNIDYNGHLVLHQNLQNPLPIDLEDPLEIKAALLTQGVVISPEVLKNHNIKNATFDAVDITVNSNIINCPVKGRFLPLSPWSIDLRREVWILSYLTTYITNVEIDLQEQLAIQQTKSGRSVYSIGFRTTDRVRIKHEAFCRYKKSGHGCAFCHLTAKIVEPFPMEDIYEVIDHYIADVSFRHFMIGGPTGEEQVEEQNILRIVRYIRSRSEKPIYVMSIPPKDTELLSEYKESGVTELAFNLEIFDRTLAKKLMPGKGQIPLEQYEKAFLEGTRLFGNGGAIRSMLLIGLDSDTSMLNGVRYLCKLGVSPMLSPFRPMAGTNLSMRVPPDIRTILHIVREARTICGQHGINLGPSCKSCQNNTLV